MSPPVPYGNVIEYIADRLYWACYTSPPTSSTPFPPQAIPDPHKIVSPEQTRPGSRSPSKRRPNQVTNSSGLKPVYFTVDDALLYNAFHHDFGPLHIGHLYRFAVTLHDILGDPKNEGRVVVFWSKPNGKARANAGCLLATYMVLVQSWPPHLALSPLAMCDPPLMPFRDAGYSQADFILNVQDVVYGVWRAKEKGLVNLREFVLDEYEKFERVDMGDFNWVSPNFLAFASPQHKVLPDADVTYPTDEDEILDSNLPTPFKNVLHHFHTRDIGLVVRLNSPLYPAEAFTALGITHMDMIFDDGTCPPLNLVKKFINIAHQTITRDNKNIAVHCKAGLGRTGCLIGAYLIYRYGFSANEVIAYMRFMRPGMVVGPQQHWLHLNQNEFRQWWFEDTILAAALEKVHASHPASAVRTPTKAPSKRASATSGNMTPNRRSILGEVDSNNETASANILPAPTPGQPRKTSSRFASTAASSRTRQYEPEPDVVDENEQASPVRRRKSAVKVDEEDLARAIESGMTEEEYMIRLHRRATIKSPAVKRTSGHGVVSATTVVEKVVEEKTRNGAGAGLIGIGAKVRSSPRRQPPPSGVRKSSGRAVSGGPA
ncbi:protein-tyrosine phosphatase-like protein [Pyronema domesticum]|uniref:protein-tyrosine-phosphatase n=1 Tax=Pyronema omphalodes (strain CBS 100304) TaxID=1076935 RepID=U4LHV2_PYROM|nr:protein-tyrosine phosphatase-like protein [Pyronema domesticum]CCX31503.1 Similar to Tyrosine-protein phosphatase CDC14; acc. no. Q00684 [Pyronema omphalodes CBS 100304]